MISIETIVVGRALKIIDVAILYYYYITALGTILRNYKNYLHSIIL